MRRAFNGAKDTVATVWMPKIDTRAVPLNPFH